MQAAARDPVCDLGHIEPEHYRLGRAMPPTDPDLAATSADRRPEQPLPIAVLVSGAGTNLQALLDTVHGREARIVAVAANLADAPALARASERGVPTAVFARADYPDRARARPCAGRLAVRPRRAPGRARRLHGAARRGVPRAASRDAVINVHPSLLPAFPGLGAIEQALAYGVKVFGVTVHFVDAGVDSGPVILQRASSCRTRATRRGAGGAAPARARAAARRRAAVRARRAAPRSGATARRHRDRWSRLQIMALENS